MKKILFATTALVATAGAASADVKLSGYGRFGLQYNEDAVNETTITSRFRLQIDATAESDGGVVFGARVRMQQDNDDPIDPRDRTTADDGGVAVDSSAPGGTFRTDRYGTGMNGVRFFVKAGGLEVGVGNIYGALEWMAGQYPIDLGLTGLGYEYTAYQFGGAAYDSDEGGSAGFNGVEAIYTVGGLNIHVSYDEFDIVNSTVSGNAADAGAEGSRTAIAVAYTFGDWTVAVAAQDSDRATDTEWTATVGGSLGPVALTLAYADNGDNGDYYVLAGLIDVGAATSIEAYVADGDTLDDTSYGLGANYDLGGGTSLQGGFASLGSGQTIADLGVRFNF